MKLDERWVAREGSIFCEKIYTAKSESGNNTFERQDSVAFNLGLDVAEHIVNLHNNYLASAAISFRER